MGHCVFSSSAMLLGEGEFRVRRSYSLKAKVSEKYGIFFSLFAFRFSKIYQRKRRTSGAPLIFAESETK